MTANILKPFHAPLQNMSGEDAACISLRSAVARMRREGAVRDFRELISTEYEIPYVISRLEGRKACIFHRPAHRGGEHRIPVVGGLYSSRKAISMVISPNLPVQDVLAKALASRGSITRGKPFFGGETLEAPDVAGVLPVLRHYPCEPAPYITAGVVFAKHPEGYVSASYHRMMPVGRSRLAMRVVEGRELHRIISLREDAGEPIEVAIAIGVPPSMALAAASPAMGVDKLELAAAIQRSPLEVASCEVVDLDVPAHSEIVLEGVIEPGSRAKEGPFYEIMGVDVARMQPVVDVKLMHLADSPLYQAILPGGREHELLMGLPVEPIILREVRKHAKKARVAMTPAGAHWIEVAVSIEKEYEGQPLIVALAAISAHKSLKSVIVVDDDIDVEDYEQVARAVAQRANPARDIHVIREVRGSSLDRSNLRYVNIGGRRVLVEEAQSKVIVDATCKAPRDLFTKPEVPVDKRRLEEILLA